MGSSLYHIRVEGLENRTARFRVSIIHPDIFVIPEKVSFALQIIADPVHHWQLDQHDSVVGSPAAEEFDLDDLLDRSWVRENALGFIERVTLSETENYPPPSYEEADAYKAFWENGDRAEGTLEVQVTHPGWLVHLEPGMEWETTSYDMGEALPWSGPRREPGDRIWLLAADLEAGMQTVERTELNGRYLDDAGVEPGFLVPAYGESYYVADEPVDAADLSDGQLGEFMLEPVVIATEHEDIVGTLLSVDDHRMLHIFTQGESSCGVRGISLGHVLSMGRARYRRRIPRNELN